MSKTFKKFSSFSEADASEDKYYLNLSAKQRVDILLDLVQQHGGQFGGTSERFERVFRVTSLRES